MAIQWLRRAWLAAIGASALLLAACGGGDIASPLSPARVIAFGDAMADLGQNGRRYTVHDGTVNNWTLAVANGYDLTLAPSSSGGLNFATGNARIRLEPDAAGSTATPTVKEQIDAFLAASRPASDDLILVSAGTSDLIVGVQAVLAGTRTADQMLADVELAARDLADQVRRLVDAGADHVAVAGVINLGLTPWARDVDRAGLMEEASGRFNAELLIALNDMRLGDQVLYIDAAYAFNQWASDSTAEFVNVEDPVCTSVDPGPGIGTGANQVNSNLCTPATIAAGADYRVYLWADRVYPTPRGHELFGGVALDRIRDRW